MTIPTPDWNLTPISQEELLRLKNDCEIPDMPTKLTYHLRLAPSGEGDRANEWNNKPHRLVYDACREIERLTAIIEEPKMTIKTTDLLELLTYAGELDLSIFVKQDEDGDYVVKFYELYTNDFAETLVINKEGEVEWCSGDNSFDYLMDTFVDMLSNKKEEKLKAQKRQELLARLTNEEKELLGVK